MTAIKIPKVYLYKRIVQAKLFIDASFSENICLDEISGAAYFSKFHFIKLFKMAYGKTPHQYLIAVRMQKAREMLSAGMAVTDVCHNLGFDSTPSFTGLFKRVHKVTPSQYQKQQCERRTAISKTPLHFIPGCFAQQHGWVENRNFQEAG